jgi:hypothetical protein
MRTAHRGNSLWQHGLEDFNVKESQVVLGIKREGVREGEVKRAREDLLEVLEVRLKHPVPEAVRLAVMGTNDPDILRRWLRVALNADTIQEFAATIVSPL